MRFLSRFFLENNKFTTILSVGLVLYGVMGLRRMNTEGYPQVDFAIATITTIYKGASAEDIEVQITRPIEDEIRRVSGIKDVKSISQANLSKIVIRVDIDNVDTPTVMDDIQRAIDRVQNLPPNLEEKPLFEEIKSEEFPIFEIAITGPNESRQRDIIAENLKEDIEESKNVKNARLVGHHEREFSIKLDHQRMLEQHIGINEIIEKNTKEEH